VIQSLLGNNSAALENAQTSLKLIMLAAQAWVREKGGRERENPVWKDEK